MAETRFHYDLQDKQLRFHVKQRVTTAQKTEFKATALLDPSSSTVRCVLWEHVTGRCLCAPWQPPELRLWP